MMDETQLEILGVMIADKASNILALSRVIKGDALAQAYETVLREIRDTSRNLYIEISRNNPWEWER